MQALDIYRIWLNRSYSRLLIFLLFFLTHAKDDLTGWSSGIALSFVRSDDPDGFFYYELEGVHLSSLAQYKDVISLMLGYGAAVGVLRHEDEAAALFNAKFEIGPGFLDNNLMIVFTFGPALITKSKFSNNDFGGPINFLSSAGIKVRPFWKISMAYRIQHMSNGNIYKENHRINLHILELNYQF